MKPTLIATFVIASFFFLGMFLGGKYLAKGEIVASLCVIGETAVSQSYLSEQQVLELAEHTGREIKTRHPNLAETISLADRTVADGLAESACTRLWGHLLKGMH